MVYDLISLVILIWPSEEGSVLRTPDEQTTFRNPASPGCYSNFCTKALFLWEIWGMGTLNP